VLSCGTVYYTVFSRLNAGGVHLKLGLVDPAFTRAQRLFGTRRSFLKCFFQPSIIYHQYWRFIEFRTKFHFESVKPFIKNTSLTGKVIELFSTLHFSEKHGGSVSATARQQTYRPSNLEQGGGAAPVPSILSKAKLWSNLRNCCTNASETLEMILS